VLSKVSPFQEAPAPEEGSEEEEQASEEEIEAFLDVGTKEGILEPSEAEMVWGIVDFGDTVVRSVMTPRIDIVGVRQEASLPEVARLFAETKHTRIPMYAGSVDQIVGILHALDVLEALQGSAQRDSRGLAKTPLFIPESKPLSELLREFQSTGQQMAVVVNEHGSTAGLVTIEDVLEEIVGEIGDEYEKPVSEREELPGGAWRLDGGAHIDVLDELFAVRFDEPPYETVGGLVMSALGDVPEAGDVAHAFGLRFTVESAEGRRVDRVRVERAAPGEAPALAAD
jgi:CBS domain containing-hemolysin-like protein